MKTVPLLNIFENLKDQRSHINKLHELNNMLTSVRLLKLDELHRSRK